MWNVSAEAAMYVSETIILLIIINFHSLNNRYNYHPITHFQQFFGSNFCFLENNNNDAGSIKFK